MTNQPIPFLPRNQTESLAWEIAEAFGDASRLPFYREICSAYDRQLVYRAYREVMSVPASGIRKTRRAFFIYLLKKYAQTT